MNCRCGREAYRPDRVLWPMPARRCYGCHFVIGRCDCPGPYETDVIQVSTGHEKEHQVKYEVDASDLWKVHDTLRANETFHRHRDEMNGAVHLAREVRWSPLTSETIAARERVEAILAPAPEANAVAPLDPR